MDYKEIFSDSGALLEAIKKADKKTREVHGIDVNLERAIFLSWWCERGNCSFCYMSTQRQKIKEKEMARRRPSSMLAEAELMRRIGWKIGFLSGGYGAYSVEETKDIAQRIKGIMGAPTWINVGVLSREEMTLFNGVVEGVVGAVETVNNDLRNKVCPGKPLEPIKQMLEDARELGLKTGMTIVLGLGEGVEDIPTLLEFVRQHQIDKITIYSLNPHKATPFSNTPPPPSLYQAGVIAALRLEFPNLKIVAGTWIDQLSNIGIVLLAGANSLTKYPFFRMFGNRYGKKVEDEIVAAGRNIVGTFTDLSPLKETSDAIELGDEIEAALSRYVQKIESKLSQ